MAEEKSVAKEVKQERPGKPPGIPQVLFAVSGIYGSYLTYGILQEWIYKHRHEDGSQFTHTFTLLLLQCVMNSIFAFVGLKFVQHKGGPETLSEWSWFAAPALTYLIAMLGSNEALKYVSYPTQALAKSCKMIPVMLCDVLIFRVRYGTMQYVYVALVTIGIAIFQRKEGGNAEDSMHGIALLALSLAMDGLTGPLQKSLVKKYHPSVHQLMFSCNFFAVIYVIILMVVTGQTMDGFHYILKPGNHLLLQYILLFSLCSAIGQNFIFYTIHTFGPLACTSITTTRKFFTILASVFLFNHPLKAMQWVGVGLVSIGLSIELYTKYQKQKEAQRLHAEAEKKQE